MPCNLSCDNKYKRWFICSSIPFKYAEVSFGSPVAVAGLTLSNYCHSSVVGMMLSHCCNPGSFSTEIYLRSHCLIGKDTQQE